MALLDEYERKARLTPGLLAILPVAFVIATLGLKQYPAVAVGTSVLTAAGGTYLLSLLVAHLGRDVQTELWREWGGRPTTQLLRFRDSATNPTQRDVWRAALEVVTGVALLSQRRESSNPQAAEDVIEAATDQVRYLSQDPRFRTVAAENAQYGFERNMYGFRQVGRTIAGLCTLALVVIWALHVQGISTETLVAGIVADAALLVGWVLIPSKERARSAALRYGNQLLQATVTVARSATGSGPSAREG